MNIPGGFEWVIILIIVVILFGVGRVGKVAGELGKGIREFRKGIGGDEEKDTTESSETKKDS